MQTRRNRDGVAGPGFESRNACRRMAGMDRRRLRRAITTTSSRAGDGMAQGIAARTVLERAVGCADTTAMPAVVTDGAEHRAIGQRGIGQRLPVSLAAPSAMPE